MGIYFETRPTKKTEQESFSSSFFPSKNLDIFLNFSSKPFENWKLHMKSAQNKGDIFNKFFKTLHLFLYFDSSTRPIIYLSWTFKNLKYLQQISTILFFTPVK